MQSDIDSTKTSRHLLISVQHHLKEQQRKWLCFEETVNTCFGSMPVFRNRELRHAATIGQTTLKFSPQGCGCTLRTWETLRLNASTFLWRTFFCYVRLMRPVESRTNVFVTCLRFILVTSRSRALLQKLTGSQLVKKFPAFCGTGRFISMFTRARHLSIS